MGTFHIIQTREESLTGHAQPMIQLGKASLISLPTGMIFTTTNSLTWYEICTFLRIIEKAFLQSGCIEWERKGFCEVIKTDCLWLKKLIGTRSDLGLTMSDGFEVFGVLVLNEHLPPDKKFTTKFGWEKDI